jgi:DNA-binding transcriptional LysR family regulator
MNDWAEFRHFKYLLAILEHHGFRAAAEYLHTAQPNLSAQAKQFQEYFGLELYKREKDGHIRLTETGIAFLSIAQGVLDARDEAIAALIAIQRGEVRSLKFGCSPCVDRAVFHTACEIHREILPDCPIRPAHGETIQLAQEILAGELDAAIVTQPVRDPRLRVETIRQDRLVACIPRDHPCAAKAVLQPVDLQANLAIFYDPQRHPLAHEELVERLAEIGVRVDEYSRASHPTEMHELVKQGYGFALIREGSALEPELVTRPIAGVNWTVDTAIVYNKQRHLRTIPVLVRHLKRYLASPANKTNQGTALAASPARNGAPKRPPHAVRKNPAQMSLLG